jgi:hypothetical protein
MKKYNIISVQYDYKTRVLDTFLEHKDAIESLTETINNEFKNNENIKNYKIYYESRDEISIYYIGYLGKTLHAKYFIIGYHDKTHDIF